MNTAALAKKLHDAEYHPCTGDYASCTALGGRYPSWEQEAKAILHAPDPSWTEDAEGYVVAPLDWRGAK